MKTQETNHEEQIAVLVAALDDKRKHFSDIEPLLSTAKSRAAGLAQKEEQIRIEISRCERDWSGDDASWEHFAPPLQKELSKIQVLRRNADSDVVKLGDELTAANAAVTRAEFAVGSAKTAKARAEIKKLTQRHAELMGEVAANIATMGEHIGPAGGDWLGVAYESREAVTRALRAKGVRFDEVSKWLP